MLDAQLAPHTVLRQTTFMQVLLSSFLLTDLFFWYSNQLTGAILDSSRDALSPPRRPPRGHKAETCLRPTGDARRPD